MAKEILSYKVTLAQKNEWSEGVSHWKLVKSVLLVKSVPETRINKRPERE